MVRKTSIKQSIRTIFVKPFTVIGATLILLLGILTLNTRSSSILCAHTIENKNVVHVSSSGFDPEKTVINTGDEVVFENTGFSDVWPASDNHPTHEEYSALDPKKPIIPGETWEFTFNEPGEYGLHDHLMPSSIGSIKVEGKTRDPSCSNKSSTKKEGSAKLNTETTSPKLPNPDIDKVIAEIRSLCASGDAKCQELNIAKVIEQNGPKPALETYKQLLEEGYIPPEGDGHQFAHRVGRKTAEFFGVGYGAFDLCSTDFNYGCQHGYFEYVLGRTDTSKDAIDAICSKIGSDKPQKAKFYCYHGAGHGVMMAEANNLQSSLDICDELDEGAAQTGCWQGVFMENVNAASRGEAQTGLFNKDDLLSPCNKLDNKYRGECYENHSGWIVANSPALRDATNYCLKAGDYVSRCLSSIGLMSTNPGWQDRLSPETKGMSLPKRGWRICQQFPDGFEGTCVNAGISNLANFDQLNTNRMVEFCQTINKEFIEGCISSIKQGIFSNSAGSKQVSVACKTLPESWRDNCGNN